MVLFSYICIIYKYVIGDMLSKHIISYGCRSVVVRQLGIVIFSGGGVICTQYNP
jgi:hypothetical protein